MSGTARIFIYGDVHAPYHCPKAVSCMLKAMSVFKPDIVVDLGDFWDCYSVSRFKKDPRRPLRLVDEIRHGKPVQESIEAAAKKADLIYLYGNHEERFTDMFLSEKMQGLHGAVSLADLAPREKWQVIPYESYIQIGRVIYTHDLGYSGVNAVRQSLMAANHSIVIGHIHRMGSHVEADIRQKPRICHSFGWLGDVRRVDYMHKVKVARDWTHGFGLGHMDLKTGTTWFSGVPIIKGRALVEGKVVEG